MENIDIKMGKNELNKIIENFDETEDKITEL